MAATPKRRRRQEGHLIRPFSLPETPQNHCELNMKKKGVERKESSQPSPQKGIKKEWVGKTRRK
jgi:hypothetical protein